MYNSELVICIDNKYYSNSLKSISAVTIKTRVNEQQSYNLFLTTRYVYNIFECPFVLFYSIVIHDN